MDYYKEIPESCKNGNHSWVTRQVFGNVSTITECRKCGKSKRSVDGSFIKSLIKSDNNDQT